MKPVTTEPTIVDKLASGGRHELANGGVVRINRPMPYLAVAFDDESHRERETLNRFVSSQANFVAAPPDEETRTLIEDVVAHLKERFGAVLIVHVWMGELSTKDRDAVQPRPEFRIIASDDDAMSATVKEFASACRDVILYKEAARVSVDFTAKPGPPGFEPLDIEPPNQVMGLEVAPAFRNQTTGQMHPIEFENLRHQTSYALKKGGFHFARSATSWAPSHYFALGRSNPSKLAREIDQELSQIHSAFNFLLQTSPLNAKEAWKRFQEQNFKVEPTFYYRPLAVDPEALKRRLFQVPIEKVDDPILVRIFREKQEELDRKLTMLREIDSRSFFLGSMQLYGEVQTPLLKLARNLLEELPARDDTYDSKPYVTDKEFAEIASEEMAYYRRQYTDFPRSPEIRSDIPPGLMVARGMLLIGEGTRISPDRVEALLEHEIGTHMVTYYNGTEQPLELLHSGLAGYEALQEGIAVLGEYLADGLTVPRMRTLAARVIAAQAIIEEASFLEVFELLTKTYDFNPEKAFTICRRTFRGGGFIKDVIYLRGLREVIRYLQSGGEFKRLFVGKLAIHHLSFVHELEERGMTNPLPLTPRMISRPTASERLERVKNGLSIVDFVRH